MQAALTRLEVTPLPASDPCRGVSARATVSPGPVFQVLKPRWRGNRVIPTARLEAMLPADVSGLASPQGLSQLGGALRMLYGERGHVDVSYRAERQILQAPPRLQLVIVIDEGPVFAMGRLTIEGIDPELAQRWVAKFPLPPGSRYDERALERFEQELAAAVQEHRGNRDTVMMQALKHPNRRTAIVDITLAIR